MADLQRWAPEVQVRLNGVPVNYLQCLNIGRSAGGHALDYAELMVIKHPTLPSSFNVKDIRLIDDLTQRRCTIHLTDEGGNSQTVHWGYIDAKSVTIDRSEHQVMTSRLQPYHFGGPIRGMRVWSPFDNESVDSLEQIVFNPQLDGRIANNASDKIDPTTGGLLFIHPECQRSFNAIATAGAGGVAPWSLASACHYLCTAGNAAETFIANPSLIELAKVLPFNDGSILRNHQQPFGEYLPANLDALLEPYGYGWKIDLGGAQPKIVVFRKGAGAPVSANLANFGTSVDLSTSNVEEMNVTTDVANRLANSIEVYGDTIMVELTTELMPAWLPEFDSYHLTQLGKLDLHGGEDKAWETTPALSRVWRDFVLNEAGDYDGVRPDNPLSSEPYDFNAAAGLKLAFHARRRKFLPCITLGVDGRPVGEHHGVLVEFFRYTRDDDGTLLAAGVWEPVDLLSSADSIGIQILDKECGIRFSGLHIPVDLATYGVNLARIRVTATVEMDARVSVIKNAVGSANIFPVARVLDVGSRFKKRGVLAISKYSGGGYSTTAVDDTAKQTTLATDLLANWNQASINGTIVLPGIDWEIANDCIGRPFAGIDGRGIDFQTTQVAPAKYPSITALKLDIVNQKTIISLDTWRRENI